MNMLYILILTTVIYGLLVFLNYKAKGKSSLFVRIGSCVFVLAYFAALTWFYGAAAFESIQINVNSISGIKGFVGSKLAGTIALVLVYLFVFFKVFYVIINISNPIKSARKEFLFVVPFVVFDIAVIPNIFTLGTTTAVLAVLSILSTGLACTKLVFCLFNNVNFTKEKAVRL